MTTHAKQTKSKQSSTPSVAVTPATTPGRSNFDDIERFNQAEAWRAAEPPTKDVAEPKSDFMAGGSKWGLGAMWSAMEANEQEGTSSKASKASSRKSAPDKAAADAQFKALIRLHTRACNLRDQTRNDMLRYMGLEADGLGKKTAALTKSAKRANNHAQVVVKRLARHITRLGDGSGGAKVGVSAAQLAGIVSRQKQALADIDYDSNYNAARLKPDTSTGGAAKYTAGAAGTATASATYGAVTSLPFAGPMLDKYAGDTVRKNLIEAGTAVTDRETATKATDRGKAIGVFTGSVAQMKGGWALQAAGTSQAVAEGSYAAATQKDMWTQRELTDAEVGLKVVAGGAAGMKAFAGSSQAQFSAAVARESGEAAPLLQQAANGLDTGSKLAQASDNATAAATGHRLVDPTQEVEGGERVLRGVNAAAKVSSVADRASSESKWRAAEGKSTPKSQLTTGLELGEAGVRGVDAAHQLVTGRSILKPEKKDSHTNRVKAAKTAGKSAVKFGKADLAAQKARKEE